MMETGETSCQVQPNRRQCALLLPVVEVPVDRQAEPSPRGVEQVEYFDEAAGSSKPGASCQSDRRG
jgi:hypothetical protein